MKKTGLLAVSALVLLGAALPALANPIMVGTTTTNNCFPFGCAVNGDYQQVYTSSDFTGPITITGLEFYNTNSNGGATAMNFGTWTISLSTTLAQWSTLSTSPMSSNLGADNTTVFSGNLAQAWAFGDTLTILFSTPFTYNPGTGNLLMDVQSSGVTNDGGDIYFDANDSGTGVFGRAYSNTSDEGGPYTGTDSIGLVTGFLTGTTSVPEPGSLGLFGLGLGLLALGGFAARARRRQASLA